MKSSFIRKTLLPALLTIGISAPAMALAETGDIALGIKGGTAGLGGEVIVGILDNLNFRTGYNTFSYEGNSTESDIDYDYKLKLNSLPILIDLHPFGGGFRVTSGIFINNNEVTGAAEPTGTTIEVGEGTYNVADVGTLNAKIDFNTAAPYLGIGWGNAVGKGSPLTIMFDIGIMFQGSPKVSLNATGNIASDVAFQENLDREISDLKDDIESVQYYPIVSLGLAYRF
jgi:hypothetical protein